LGEAAAGHGSLAERCRGGVIIGLYRVVSDVRGGSRESLVRESRSVCKRECRANLLTKVGLRSESAYM
jgi:hypothetical protein